jgi:hypothetical protein
MCSDSSQYGVCASDYVLKVGQKAIAHRVPFFSTAAPAGKNDRSTRRECQKTKKLSGFMVIEGASQPGKGIACHLINFFELLSSIVTHRAPVLQPTLDH